MPRVCVVSRVLRDQSAGVSKRSRPRRGKTIALDEVCLNLGIAKTKAIERTCIVVLPVTLSLGMKTHSNRRESQLFL
jgi:hypothetical protein